MLRYSMSLMLLSRLLAVVFSIFAAILGVRQHNQIVHLKGSQS